MMTLNQKYNLFKDLQSNNCPISTFFDGKSTVLSSSTSDGRNVLAYAIKINDLPRHNTKYFLRVKRGNKVIAEYNNGMFANIIYTLLSSIKRHVKNGISR